MLKLYKYFCVIISFFVSIYCHAIAQPCYETSRVCSDSSVQKCFNGQCFTKEQLGIDCWKYDIKKTCPKVDECQSFLNRGCIIDASKNICTEHRGAENCVSWKKQGYCETGGASGGTMIACGNQICTPDGNGGQLNCYQADQTTDSDFESAMAALEIANEMGKMKNCYDRTTGAKCQPVDPNDPSKGANPNCECFFFQGKFVVYSNSFHIIAGNGCVTGKTFTGCEKISQKYSSLSTNGLQAGEIPQYAQRNIDPYSDKGQLTKSLTGNANTTGIRAGNPYTYSSVALNQTFNDDGTALSGNADPVTTLNQNANNGELLQVSNESQIIDKDDPNSASNQTHWNNGGTQTGQGNTATKQGTTMKIVQQASKALADITDFSSIWSNQCTPEEQSVMLNVGKGLCMFDYGGVKGPNENDGWTTLTFTGKTQDANFSNCTKKLGFWGAVSNCSQAQIGWSLCKSNHSSGACANTVVKMGACCDLNHGNDEIMVGKVNCCFQSKISKLINIAAFQQGVGGRPNLNNIASKVARYNGTNDSHDQGEVCSSKELQEGKCQNSGLNTAQTFQAMCERGISLQEMQQIDFSRIDFTEFMNDVQKNMNTNPVNPNTQNYQNRKDKIETDINNKKQSLQNSNTNYFDM